MSEVGVCALGLRLTGGLTTRLSISGRSDCSCPGLPRGARRRVPQASTRRASANRDARLRHRDVHAPHEPRRRPPTAHALSDTQRHPPRRRQPRRLRRSAAARLGQGGGESSTTSCTTSSARAWAWPGDRSARPYLPARVVWAPTPVPSYTIDTGVAAACDAAVRRLEAAGTEVIVVDPLVSGNPLGDW